jgi:subtilase family serine protease
MDRGSGIREAVVGRGGTAQEQLQRFRRCAAVFLAAASVGAGTLALAPAAAASGISVDRECAAPARGQAACLALVVSGSPLLSAYSGPPGYHPADLISAYKLTATKGTGQTVAVVDAFDNPKAEADLAVYRSTFGLPACTTANKCFKKVNQNGAAAPLPAANTQWGVEISLDLDMVSAICSHCHILLVEASNARFTNLGAAVNRAALMHATEISNSYGGAEGGASAADYNHPGIPITASSGDSAFAAGPQTPADFSTVTAVGGTTLSHVTGGRGWSETAWANAGSGCSTVIAKPAWQHDTSCATRLIADVSAVADPKTGVSLYDTYGYAGFMVAGGTSASAPIIAGVYALAGNAALVTDASLAYAHAANLFDVTAGKNGTCAGAPVCTAAKGADGPTGLGTPDGAAAF